MNARVQGLVIGVVTAIVTTLVLVLSVRLGGPRPAAPPSQITPLPQIVIRERVMEAPPAPATPSTPVNPAVVAADRAVRPVDPVIADRQLVIARDTPAAAPPETSEPTPSLSQAHVTEKTSEPPAPDPPDLKPEDPAITGETKTAPQVIPGGPSLLELLLTPPRVGDGAAPTKSADVSSPLVVPQPRPDNGSRKAAGLALTGDGFTPITTYDLVRRPIRVPLGPLGKKQVTSYGVGVFGSTNGDGGPQASIGDRLRLGVGVPIRQSLREQRPVLWGFGAWSF